MMSWLKIFSAVIAANLATAVIGFLVSTFLFASAMNMTMSAVQDRMFGGHVTFGSTQTAPDPEAVRAMNEKLKQQRLEREAQARRQQTLRERQQNAQRIKAETCNFWRQQYQQSPTDKNKAYRDSACSKL
jgi:hypothetical protein